MADLLDGCWRAAFRERSAAAWREAIIEDRVSVILWWADQALVLAADASRVTLPSALAALPFLVATILPEHVMASRP